MRRGRPAREPTASERERVRELAGKGSSRTLIAAALGRSVPNLRKYFAEELAPEKNSPPSAQPAAWITTEMRDDVALMAAGGEPHGSIARLIGVSEEDLARHFAHELANGRAHHRLAALRRLERLARGGSVAAARKLADMTAPPPEAQAPDRPAQSGKKAAQKAEAHKAVAGGGKFAPRTAPRLATVGGKPVGNN